MSKIKIMHFIHALGTGGAETLVKEYAMNMDKDLFEMIVLCLVHRPDSPYERIMIDNNMMV